MAVGITRSAASVLRQGDIDEFRATRMIQDKAQTAGYGESFSRTATPYWIIRLAPFGRAVKRSSAVLSLLARTRHCRRDAPSGRPFQRLAEPIKITLTEYQWRMWHSWRCILKRLVYSWEQLGFEYGCNERRLDRSRGIPR